MPLTILVIGCGSIGQRHIDNLLTLGIRKIFVYDRIAERAIEMERLYGVESVSSLESALDSSADAVFICTPPIHHIDMARKAVGKGANVFLEKPISHSLEGVDELLREAEQKSLKVMMGYNLRFHAGLQEAKSLIDKGTIGKLLAAHAEFGQYLPDWRPNRDYREGYFHDPNQGGGIILDASHEIDYLQWFIGGVNRVYASMATLSELDISSEDFATIVLKTRDNVLATARLDCIQRGYARNCKFIGSQGTLIWDFVEGVKIIDDRGQVKTELDIKPDVNEMYLKEVDWFLGCVRGDLDPPVDGSSGKRVLEIVLAAKVAAKSNREIQV